MERTITTKANQRFVLYISHELRQRIEQWVTTNGITMADFGREAFKSYLENKRKEERMLQLAETCKLFKQQQNRVNQEWKATDFDSWPM